MDYSHCTLCGATGSATADGKAVIASSTDDPFTTRTRVVVEAPAGGYKFVAAENVPVADSAFISWERAHMGGAVDYPGEQLYQDRSWGRFEAFCVDNLEPGVYVTVDGQRTPLANRCRAT
ncbi:MAG TPA: hypothetical protein ENH80_01315 [Phycisphaerae bacterium]|nr:hypothetical protein [Phycisphaerae bacterium]HDZ42557.1 hypothetical protein [Phycisphaerae bacterium]